MILKGSDFYMAVSLEKDKQFLNLTQLNINRFITEKVYLFTSKKKDYRTNIPSVAFPKIQDLSLMCLVILCPAYATVRFVVNQTVKQD